jgi:hypothetical protein
MNSNLLNFFTGNRYIGHTTLSIVGAKEYKEPFYIIGATLEHAIRLSKEINNPLSIPISLHTLLISRGNDKIACLIDNYTIMTEIERLLNEHNKIVDDIHHKREIEKKSLVNDTERIRKLWYEDLREAKKIKLRNVELSERIIKTKNRIRPTLLEISRMSLWDRIFNFNKIAKRAIDDYLY